MDLQPVAPPLDRRAPSPASLPAKPFEFLGSFSPAHDIERAAMLMPVACNRTSHRPHVLT